LAAYGWLAFHDPLARWTAWANPDIEVRVNGALFGWPSPVRIWALLFSGYRGLLFTSPVLALAPFGVPALHRTHPAAAYVCAGTVTAFVALVASFNAWHGGWTPGPRYLVPCLPFAAVPLGFAFARRCVVASVLAVLSAAMMTAITAVAIEVPATVRVLLRDFVAPYLLQGRVSVNPQGLDEYMPPPSYQRMNPPENARSRNLGELLLPGRVASLLPLALAWSALGAPLWRALARPAPYQPCESASMTSAGPTNVESRAAGRVRGSPGSRIG
jgi:hypothetical protein